MKSTTLTCHLILPKRESNPSENETGDARPTAHSQTSGTNLTIKASGYLNQEIKQNSTVLLEVKIRVGGSSIPFITQKQDLCDQLESVDESCPVQKGNLTFTRNVTLPEQIPKATYLVRADVFDQDEEEVTCVEATVAF